jgi:hypothetical protein
MEILMSKDVWGLSYLLLIIAVLLLMHIVMVIV